MGEKLRPSRHSRQDMTSNIAAHCREVGGSLLQQAKVPGDHLAFQYSPSMGQLPRFWPTLLATPMLQIPKPRQITASPAQKTMENSLPKIPTCHKELSLYTPKDCRYSHTIYRHAKQPSHRPYVTCHLVLPHAYLFVFVRVFVFMACPATVSTPSPPAILIPYLSCGYKLPRKAAPAASRQLELRPCSPNGYGLGKRRYVTSVFPRQMQQRCR